MTATPEQLAVIEAAKGLAAHLHNAPLDDALEALAKSELPDEFEGFYHLYSDGSWDVLRRLSTYEGADGKARAWRVRVIPLERVR